MLLVIIQKKFRLVMDMEFSGKSGKEYVCILCAAILLLCAGIASAEIQNVSLTVIGEQDYSDIFLGISTGGYDLLAEKGSSFAFEVFVKNGMPDRALHKIAISPASFPFPINSITPKTIEEVKPMEIVMFIVNTTIPADAAIGKYSVSFDVSSDEFPVGVFFLSTEIKVLNKINIICFLCSSDPGSPCSVILQEEEDSITSSRQGQEEKTCQAPEEQISLPRSLARREQERKLSDLKLNQRMKSKKSISSSCGGFPRYSSSYY
jgi:hypothetical protein